MLSGSDIPECAEVVEDKALIFQKTNVEDLQEKLQDACDHPEMVMKMKNQAADLSVQNTTGMKWWIRHLHCMGRRADESINNK